MKRAISLVIMFTILFISISVYAASSATMKLSASTTALKEGDEVTITLNLNSVTENEKGVFGVIGEIVYDKNVFETIAASNVTAAEGWSMESNPANNKFVGTCSGKKSGAILNLKLKVKSSLKTQSTTVTFKNITVNGEDDEEVAVPSVSISLGITGTNNGETNNGGAANGGATNGGTNNGGQQAATANTNAGTVKTQESVNTPASTEKAKGTDVTTSNTKLPKTGVSPFAVIAIVVVAVIGTFSIIRYKNIMK